MALVLKHTGLRGFVPATLGNLTGLKMLDLFNNSITGIAQSVFTRMTRLAQVRLSLNKLASFESQIANKSNLWYFSAEGNAITRLGSGLFTNVSLSIISFAHNSITVVEPGAFSNASSLNRLSLSHNHISVITTGTFVDMSGLITLDISSNNITVLEYHSFVNLTSLTECLWGGNPITTIEDDAFVNSLRYSASRFDTLSFGLTTLDAGTLTQFASFEGFLAFGSSLTYVSPWAFHNISTYSVILDNCQLTVIETSVFENLPQLTTLTLEPLPLLTFVAPKAFTNLPSLTHIYISSTLLTSFPGSALWGVPSLFTLRVNHALLTEIPRGLPSLNSLNLDNNFITSFVVADLAVLTNLSILWLNENAITNIVLPSASLSIFSVLPAISELKLNGNLIERLPLNTFAGGNLTTLTLQDNLITTIAVGTLADIAVMTTAMLSPNIVQCTASVENASCSSCTLGYTFDPVSAACVQPPFGPAPSTRWDTIDLDGILGSPHVPSLLYLNTTYGVAAPDLSPKETAFVGYRGSFAQITYSVSFPHSQEVNISCGTYGVVTGNSSGGPITHRVLNPQFARSVALTVSMLLNTTPQFSISACIRA